MENLATILLLIADDLRMRKLPPIAAKELLEIVMRPYEGTSTLLTSNRPLTAGGSYWMTAPPSPRCWTDCSITVTSSNAGQRSWWTKTGLPSPLQTGQNYHRPGPSHWPGLR